MLFENRSISISKNKANYTLKVKHNISRRFWEKTFKMIGNKRSGEDKITFYAHSIERLQDLLKKKNNMLSYHHMKLLFLNFREQLKELEKDDMGITSLDVSDFLIVNKEESRADSVIIFINTGKFMGTDKGNFVVKTPGDLSKFMNKFAAPEIKQMNTIPGLINRRNIYYSIGSLMTYCLTGNKNEITDYEKELESINESKIYYGILRCLEKNWKERYYLYI